MLTHKEELSKHKTFLLEIAKLVDAQVRIDEILQDIYNNEPLYFKDSLQQDQLDKFYKLEIIQKIFQSLYKMQCNKTEKVKSKFFSFQII